MRRAQQPLARAQQAAGLGDPAAARARADEADANAERRVGRRNRGDVDAERRARGVSRLHMAQPQLGLECAVEHEPDALRAAAAAADGREADAAARPLVERQALDAVHAPAAAAAAAAARRERPVEHRAVEHVRVRDELVDHARERARDRERVAREAADGRTDARRHDKRRHVAVRRASARERCAARERQRRRERARERQNQATSNHPNDRHCGHGSFIPLSQLKLPAAWTKTLMALFCCRRHKPAEPCASFSEDSKEAPESYDADELTDPFVLGGGAARPVASVADFDAAVASQPRSAHLPQSVPKLQPAALVLARGPAWHARHQRRHARGGEVHVG